MKIVLHSIFYLMCLFKPAFVFGQSLETHFNHLSSRNGLTSDEVICFYKDSRGFLWMGTKGDGLNRWDGKNIKRFVHIIGDKKSLMNNDVKAISEADDGKIWVATMGGLSVLNFDNTFNNYTELKTDTGKIDLTIGIFSVAKFNHFMYLGLSNGIVKTDDKFRKPLATGAFITKGKLPEVIRCIPTGMLVSKSGIWISSFKGIFYSPDGNTFMHKNYNPFHIRILEQGYIGAAAQGFNGDIYYTKWGNPYLYHYQPGSKKTDSVIIEDLDHISAMSMVQIAENTFWASTMFKGIAEFSLKPKSKVRLIKHTEKIPGSLASNGTQYMYRDAEGTVFVSTGEGIDYVHAANCNFTQLNLKVDDGADFPTRSPFALLQDKDSFLWAGSFSNGLFKTNLTTGEVTHAKLVDEQKSVWIMNEFDGEVVLGTYAGIGKYSFRNQQFSELNFPPECKDYFTNGTQFMLRDAKNNWYISIWQTGLLFIDKNMRDWHLYMPNDSVKSILQNTPEGGYIDAQNRLWFGYLESPEISCLNLNNLKIEHFELVPRNSELDHGGTTSMLAIDNALWITTAHSGLFRFDMVNHHIEKYNTGNGMPSDNMNFLVLGPGNVLWIGTTSGLVRFEIQNYSIFTYHFSDGLPSEFLTESDLIFTKDGNGILICDKYLLRFNPKQLISNTNFPKLAFTSVKIGGIEIPLIPNHYESDFYYNDKTISFDFTGINFIDADKNNYSYMLAGFDNKWVDLGKKSNVYFTTLPPGDYTLMLRCTNNAAAGFGKILTYRIHVHGPFWKTWWFIVLMGIILVSVVVLIYNYRLKQIYKIQAMQDKISKDLHDDIGSSLSSISIFSEVAKRLTDAQVPAVTPILENIQTTAKNTMENMSDIVWAINPKNDRFANVLDRIQIFANQILFAKGVNFSFQLPEDISLKTLTIQQRKNIYLICKEAINNVAKYAQANACQLNVYTENKWVVIEIEDNGKGIDTEKTESLGGNGIINMKKRAEELNAKLDIISNLGLGTKLLLKLSL